MHASPASTPYPERVAFMTELAGQLHAYGTTAQRLEAALLAVAERLGLACEPWVNPTGMILSFRDPDDAQANDLTRVIRLPPGETDLSRLARADRIAEDVLAGKLGVSEGQRALAGLAWTRSARWQAMEVLAYALIAGAVGCLLRLPWLDIGTAAFSGAGIGVLAQLAERMPRLRESLEALAAMLAAAIAALVASLIGPLNLNTVIIASVIVLLPGMALTNAINELTSQHLVAGTARFAGALTTILKLTIGTMLALTLVKLVGLAPAVRYSRPQPTWVEAAGLLVACYAFAVAFRASRGDYPLVMLSAAAGYLISRVCGELWGTIPGVFLAAFAMTMIGNAYARWRNRPGALIRLPGIILLVPGSVGFRGLISLMQQQDIEAGQAALLAVFNILMALIAGLIFGNLLVPARRNL